MPETSINEGSEKRKRKRSAKKRHSETPPKHYFTRDEVERAMRSAQDRASNPVVANMAASIQIVLAKMGDNHTIGFGCLSRSERNAMDMFLKPTQN